MGAFNWAQSSATRPIAARSIEIESVPFCLNCLFTLNLNKYKVIFHIIFQFHNDYCVVIIICVLIVLFFELLLFVTHRLLVSYSQHFSCVSSAIHVTINNEYFVYNIIKHCHGLTLTLTFSRYMAIIY